MSKFNVGDRVVRTGESVAGIVRGEEYTVKEIAGNGFVLYLEGFDEPFGADFFTPALTIDKVTSGLDVDSLPKVPNEPEFEWGEEVEVSNNGIDWIPALYVAESPTEKACKHIVTPIEKADPMDYSHCRKPKRKVSIEHVVDHLEIMLSIMKAHPEGNYTESLKDALEMEKERNEF